MRADVPGAQRHGDPGQLQCGAGPGLCVRARALAQPGGPLRARGRLRVLAPRASPPGETPLPSSTQASLPSAGSSPLHQGHPTGTVSGLRRPPSLLKLLLPPSVSGRWFQGGGSSVEKPNQQRDGDPGGEEDVPHSPQPGSEWQEDCDSCRCVRGRSVCTQRCPPLTCAQVPPAALLPSQSGSLGSLPASLPRGWS